MKTRILLFLLLSSCANTLPRKEVVLELPQHNEVERVKYALPISAPYLTVEDSERKIKELKLYNQILSQYSFNSYYYYQRVVKNMYDARLHIFDLINNLSINTSSKDLEEISKILDAYNIFIADFTSATSTSYNKLLNFKTKYNIPQ